MLGTTAEAEEIRLMVRGDDLEMTQGSLVAFERAFNEGILTCASILVCAPWFEAAAALGRKNPGWCTGVHLSLVGEWRGYRWRPVLPWNQVRTLVDEDGFLFRFPGELWRNKPKVDDIEAEFRAQVSLAKKKGIRVQYLDAHYMAYSSYPGLEKMIRKLSEEFDLPVSGWMKEKRVRSVYTVPLRQKEKAALKIVEELGPGLWLWTAHPGIDSPEQRALVHTRMEDFPVSGGVGFHRAEETSVLMSPKLKGQLPKRG
jgi:hypothetical protein